MRAKYRWAVVLGTHQILVVIFVLWPLIASTHCLRNSRPIEHPYRVLLETSYSSLRATLSGCQPLKFMGTPPLIGTQSTVLAR